MNQEIFEKVCAFVAEHRSVKKGELTEQTELLKLGMDGDDAREFMEAFSDKFAVDMSEFEFSKHFGPEGFNPIYYFYCLLFSRDKLRQLPITLGDLTKAAQNKKWGKR
jgi:hypothetical protein